MSTGAEVSSQSRSVAPDDGPEVELMPMRRRHLRAVLRIEAHNPHRPWSLGLFMGELALRHSRIYTVAGIDGAVVGFGGLLLTGADAHITTIAVDPEWRRHGVASRMMVLLARQAAGRGAQNMTLEVRATNDGAQALYSRFGLEPAGLRKNYYSDLKEDAVVMWALDIGSEAYASRLDVIAEGLAGSVALEGWA